MTGGILLTRRGGDNAAGLAISTGDLKGLWAGGVTVQDVPSCIRDGSCIMGWLILEVVCAALQSYAVISHILHAVSAT